MTFKSSVGAACPGEEVTFKVENMPLMKEIEPNESKWFRNDR
jgi:hypothetical protein